MCIHIDNNHNNEHTNSIDNDNHDNMYCGPDRKAADTSDPPAEALAAQTVRAI